MVKFYLMRNTLILLTILFFLPFVKGQTIRRIKDKHIVGQEKRQVFYQWGDWHPEPKYFLGIQTNYAYAMVWGWLAPSGNRDYKGGSDIRPLSLTGLQNQRYATTLVQQDKTSDIQAEAKLTYEENLKEFYHFSNATSSADPLYLLYYKDVLSSLDNFDTNSSALSQWGFTSSKAWERFNNYGIYHQSRYSLQRICYFFEKSII